MIDLQYRKYRLEFVFPFGLAHSKRIGTDVVYVELSQNGHTGYGEAVLPPYLPENQTSVIQFLENVRLPSAIQDLDIAEWMTQLDVSFPGNMTAKSALDMALHQLKANLLGISVPQLLGVSAKEKIDSTYTISLGELDEIQHKLNHGSAYKMIKLKLGSTNDKEIIQHYRSLSDKPFCVDANQGWENRNDVSEIVQLLEQEGCFLIEQPFHKANLEAHRQLRQETSIPIIADESIQTIHDLDEVSEAFDGINVKLAKCGGLSAAQRLILAAKKLELKVLIGCMSDSSVGVGAARNLASLADWCDLDGPDLINNDPEIKELFL